MGSNDFDSINHTSFSLDYFDLIVYWYFELEYLDPIWLLMVWLLWS